MLQRVKIKKYQSLCTFEETNMVVRVLQRIIFLSFSLPFEKHDDC